MSRYEEFLKTNLLNNKKKHVLFLELGVGEMTPGIIALPFWEMVKKHPNTRYVSINLNHSSAPVQLGTQAIALEGDLAKILSAAVRE